MQSNDCRVWGVGAGRLHLFPVPAGRQWGHLEEGRREGDILHFRSLAQPSASPQRSPSCAYSSGTADVKGKFTHPSKGRTILFFSFDMEKQNGMFSISLIRT